MLLAGQGWCSTRCGARLTSTTHCCKAYLVTGRIKARQLRSLEKVLDTKSYADYEYHMAKYLLTGLKVETGPGKGARR